MLKRVDVLAILKGYRNLEKDLCVTKLTLKDIGPPDYNGTIEGLTFTPKSGIRVQEGCTSDKTGDIAMKFRGAAEEEAQTMQFELTQLQQTLEKKISWINDCINLLDDPLPEIVRAMYIGNDTREKVCDKFCISQSTLTRCQHRALDELAILFEKRAALAKIPLEVQALQGS